MRRPTARPARLLSALIAPVLIVSLLLGACTDADRELLLATTTSTENSGLLDELIPLFEEQTGDHVKVVAVGSGAALALGRRGDVDVLLVHSPAAELEFVAEGFGVERTRVMYNDFLIVGPASDPAGIGGTTDAARAFSAIAAAGGSFLSRGDDSGTHARERALWAAAGLPVPVDRGWYAESGQGMGATLTIAAEQGRYTLTDRGSWLAHALHDRLPPLVSGDEALFNVYHVIVVNPDRHEVNAPAARRFLRFMTDRQTLERIAGFGVEQYGEALFHPDAALPTPATPRQGS